MDELEKSMKVVRYGFDPYEPSDSPYGIGNTSVMDEIDEITYEEAMKRTGGIE